MIGIGNDYGGPELRDTRVQKMFSNAGRTAMRVRNKNYDDGTEAWINPIYIVPGSIHKPEFEGYELGHFSAKKKGLVVKIAVPQSVADGECISDFITTSLREAVRLAAAHFASKGISFSALKAEKVILAVEAALEKA